jgi:D-beta-D-heptose 7-phosphate kinase/D-beta-D-heptose 1-phosphate adenosyltransferase
MRKIFVNGTFDIIHRGHIEMLNFARKQGDWLTVAIDGDERVKSLKGPTRPINSVDERWFLLMNLKPVNEVFVFNSDEELIKLISEHDAMVKGSDYIGKDIVGQEVCREIIFFNLLKGYSTSETIKRIITR